jgi:hypothetical protein
MTPDTVKAMLYGGLKELANNHKYFRKSDIGRQHEYSKWTENGEHEVKEFVKLMTTQMLIAEDTAIEDKAKDMVMENLKK